MMSLKLLLDLEESILLIHFLPWQRQNLSRETLSRSFSRQFKTLNGAVRRSISPNRASSYVRARVDKAVAALQDGAF